jgi:hypothetical protein
VENAWGFGQCLSSTMLLLIIFAAIEVCSGIVTTHRFFSRDLSNKRAETSQKSKKVAKATDKDSTAEDLTTTRTSLDEASAHDDESRAHQPGSLGSANADLDAEDISVQRLDANSPAIPLQAVCRSSTTISLEERSIGHNSQQSLPENGSYSRSHDAPQCASPPTGIPQVTAPHQDFYRYRWFRTLTLLIYLQALMLSMYVLLSPYGLVPMPNTNPLTLLQNVFTWTTLYAPMTTITFSFYGLLPRASANWRWKVSLARWYESRWPRPHTLQHTQLVRYLELTFISFLLFLNISLLIGIPIDPVWEDAFPFGQYITIYVIGILIVIGVPWAIVLRKMLLGLRTSSQAEYSRMKASAT